MDQTTYEGIKALNWSTLKVLAESAARCRHRIDHPMPDRAAFVLGRAVHCRVLEPESYAERYAICDVRRDARTKAYQEWLANHAGAEALTEADGAAVETMARAVLDHPVASELLRGGRAEEPVTWTDPTTGIACKGRLDYLTPHLLVDLKTVEAGKFSARAWSAAVARMLYHAQVAWYHDGAVAAGLLDESTALPWIIRVSKIPSGETLESYQPEAACDQLTERSYLAGQRVYRDLIQRYAGCQASGQWSIAYPSAGELEVPIWAPGIEQGETPEEAW